MNKIDKRNKPKKTDPFSSSQQATQQQPKQPDPFSGGTPMSITDDQLPF